jgi:RNA polymerase sigma factor (TIGR02999 family)
VSEIAKVLEGTNGSEQQVAEKLLPLVYGELRQLAAAHLAREAPGHTLQPTALVHEAWLRLGGNGDHSWQNRAHFFGAAAEAMRQVLVENARRKLRLKRGGGRSPAELEESAIAAPAEDEKVLQVHEALEILAKEDREKAHIVKLRFFVGLNYDEIAALLGVNEKTVRRHWEVAKVRLFHSIKAAR